MKKSILDGSVFRTVGYEEARDLRRQDARRADIERLQGEVKKFFKFNGFNWLERYNPVYLGKYARGHKWQLSRLTKAVETLDYRWRVAVNHKLWENRKK